MKRTILSIKEEINHVLIPAFSDLPKQKRPRNKKEWIEQHELLTKKLDSIKTSSSRIFSCKDVLFYICTFLVPRKTSDFKEFLISLREETLVLRKVSKTIKIHVSAIVRQAIENFVAPLGHHQPAHFKYLLQQKSTKQENFLKALDLMEAKFLSMDNKWPYARVSRKKAKQVWNLDEDDLLWSGVQFTCDKSYKETKRFSCATYIMSWVAMTCHYPCEEMYEINSLHEWPEHRRDKYSYINWRF